MIHSNSIKSSDICYVHDVTCATYLKNKSLMILGQKRNLSLEWKSCDRPKTQTPTHSDLSPSFYYATRGVLQEVTLDWSLQRQTWRTHWPDCCTFRSLIHLIHLIQQHNTTTQYQICQQINKNAFLGLTKDSTYGNVLNMNRPQDKRHMLQYKMVRLLLKNVSFTLYVPETSMGGKVSHCSNISRSKKGGSALTLLLSFLLVLWLARTKRSERCKRMRASFPLNSMDEVRNAFSCKTLTAMQDVWEVRFWFLWKTSMYLEMQLKENYLNWAVFDIAEKM